MTQPVSYEPKTPIVLEAMLHDGTAAKAQEIVDWVTPLIAGNELVGIHFSGRVDLVLNDENISVARGWYIYRDTEGFHVIERGAFELHYQVSDGL